MKGSFLRIFVAVSAAFGAASCNAGGGLKDDVCISTRDCAGGYQCRVNTTSNSGIGTCQLATTGGFTTTEKVCIKLICTEDQDCVAPQPTGACSNGICTCNGDEDCAAGFCLNTRCVTCRDGNDCGEGQVCNAFNECEDKCESRFDCAAFHDCQTETCVFVGCVSDRECKIDAHDLDWACDQSLDTPRCRMKCKSDFDCAGLLPTGYGYAETCSGGYCVPIGCEDEIECHNVHGRNEHGYRCEELPEG